MADLQASLARKARESAALLEAFIPANGTKIEDCAREMAAAFTAGGRLFVMGNGGSSCDAQHVAVEFMHPILEKRPALPAIVLGTDPALLTAIGNDQDFSVAFARQLKMLAKPGDMVLGLSTSGKSANVTRALQAAKEMNLLTIGFTGRDGGRMPELCKYCFTVPSFSIHRIQEAHGVLVHVLWDLIHVVRGEEDVL